MPGPSPVSVWPDVREHSRRNFVRVRDEQSVPGQRSKGRRAFVSPAYGLLAVPSVVVREPPRVQRGENHGRAMSRPRFARGSLGLEVVLG